MTVAGLHGDALALSSGVEFIEEQVIAGRREFALDVIQAAIEARGLRIEDARAIVSIATLLPDPLASHALYAIEWVDRFEEEDANLKRRPRPPRRGRSCRRTSRALRLRAFRLSWGQRSASWSRGACAWPRHSRSGPRSGWSPALTSRRYNGGRSGGRRLRTRRRPRRLSPSAPSTRARISP